MKTTNDVRLGTRGPSVYPIALGCMGMGAGSWYGDSDEAVAKNELHATVLREGSHTPAVPYADYGVAEVVRMLKLESLRVFALTGASVAISHVPGVINARATAKNLGSTETWLESSWRSGGPQTTRATD